MPSGRVVRRGDQPTAAVRRKLSSIHRVLIPWGRNHFARYPWRTEKNQFHALVAEVLLQRTRADQVVPVFEEFKNTFASAADLAGAPLAKVERVIRPLGLRWRAKFLKRLGAELGSRGEVPKDRTTLKTLPGVGPYAAAAYVSFHRRRRGVLLDSNIVRFYGRFLGLPTGPETRRSKRFEMIADAATPQTGTRAFNYALLDFTRGICRTRPMCPRCPLKRSCYTGRQFRAKAARE